MMPLRCVPSGPRRTLNRYSVLSQRALQPMSSQSSAVADEGIPDRCAVCACPRVSQPRQGFPSGSLMIVVLRTALKVLRTLQKPSLPVTERMHMCPDRAQATAPPGNLWTAQQLSSPMVLSIRLR